MDGTITMEGDPYVYGVAFTTVSEDKVEPKKARKKKEVTCIRCKKVGHYVSECK